MDARSILEGIIHSQRFGILATSGTDSPYQNIVAFAAVPDLEQIIFATPRRTSKYRNIKSNRNISLFIDDRRNSEKDIGEATGICVVGEASELKGARKLSALKLYSAKHPGLKEFASSKDTALFSMSVSKYLMVCRFQNVVELTPPSLKT